MICGVASVEPPSVITISSGGRVCASRLSSSSRIDRSSSRTGTTTLTFIGNRDQSRFHTKAQRKTQSTQRNPLCLCVNFVTLCETVLGRDQSRFHTKAQRKTQSTQRNSLCLCVNFVTLCETLSCSTPASPKLNNPSPSA